MSTFKTAEFNSLRATDRGMYVNDLEVVNPLLQRYAYYKEETATDDYDPLYYNAIIDELMKRYKPTYILLPSRYKYRPDIFCFFNYQDPDYYPHLMRVNRLESWEQFVPGMSLLVPDKNVLDKFFVNFGFVKGNFDRA